MVEKEAVENDRGLVSGRLDRVDFDVAVVAVDNSVVAVVAKPRGVLI